MAHEPSCPECGASSGFRLYEGATTPTGAQVYECKNTECHATVWIGALRRRRTRSMTLWPKVRIGVDALIDANADVGYPCEQTLSAYRQVMPEGPAVDFVPRQLEKHPLLVESMSETEIGASATIRAHSVIYEGVFAGYHLDVAIALCDVRPDPL